MTREQIATADIYTINCRQDALKGNDSTEAGIERSLIEQRREELAIEFYGPINTQTPARPGR